MARSHRSATDRRRAGATPRGRVPQLPGQLGPLRIRRSHALRFVDDAQDSPEIWTEAYENRLLAEIDQLPLDGGTGAFLDGRIDAHAKQDRARIQRDHRLEVINAEAVADHHAVRAGRWQRRLDDLRVEHKAALAQLAEIDAELASRRSHRATADDPFEQITFDFTDHLPNGRRPVLDR